MRRFYSQKQAFQQAKAAVRSLLPLLHSTALALVRAVLHGELGEGWVWLGLELAVGSSFVQRVREVREVWAGRAGRAGPEAPTWIPTMVDVEA